MSLHWNITTSARRHSHWSTRPWTPRDETSFRRRAVERSQAPDQSGSSLHRSAGAPPPGTGATCGSASRGAPDPASSAAKTSHKEGLRYIIISIINRTVNCLQTSNDSWSGVQGNNPEPPFINITITMMQKINYAYRQSDVNQKSLYQRMDSSLQEKLDSLFPIQHLDIPEFYFMPLFKTIITNSLQDCILSTK